MHFVRKSFLSHLCPFPEDVLPEQNLLGEREGASSQQILKLLSRHVYQLPALCPSPPGTPLGVRAFPSHFFDFS